MFCPECGSILLPKTKNKKRVVECSCGYKEKDLSRMETLREKINSEIEIPVIENDLEILPETEEECPKCQNKTAYFWTVQTRAGDEPETKFLKCKKCKYTWRDYS